MAKFDLFDFDLTGGMTDREFKDTLGAVSAFCIYEDATGIHSHTAKASASLFNTGGALADKEPTSIIAIGAGVTTMVTFISSPSLEKLESSSWDMSKITSLNSAFANCKNLKFVDTRNWDLSTCKRMDFCFGSAAGNDNKITAVDLSKSNTISATAFTQMFCRCSSLKSLGLSVIPSGCNCSGMFIFCTSLTDVFFGEGCRVYATVPFPDSPLTYQSVCNVLDALADTPDEGATITFKSGLYAGFTEEQQAVIDGKVADVVANGWTIVNMGA